MALELVWPVLPG